MYRAERRRPWVLPLLCIASSMIGSLAHAEKADLVIVSKTESRLYLESAGKRLASFKVVFGGNPRGHKQQEGDERTPEGKYVLDYKKPNSEYYKAIHISYPNAQDRAAAKARGISPGGQIMIHGQRNGLGWLAPIAQLFNWTDGCIGLSDADMELVWQAVDAGTPIEINP